MYLIREVFQARPGKAKELVKKFKLTFPHLEKSGDGKNFKVMTDAVGDYWTVVMEYETEDMGKFFTNLRGTTADPELMEIMKGYMDLVDGGKREIFMIE